MSRVRIVWSRSCISCTHYIRSAWLLMWNINTYMKTRKWCYPSFRRQVMIWICVAGKWVNISEIRNICKKNQCPIASNLIKFVWNKTYFQNILSYHKNIYIYLLYMFTRDTKHSNVIIIQSNNNCASRFLNQNNIIFIIRASSLAATSK